MSNSAASKTCLVLMLKAPERSKRRLARHIGDLAEDAATHLAACALEDMPEWPGSACFAPASASDRVWLDARIAPGAMTVVQHGDNLGTRINCVNDELHRRGVARQLFIGIDCPGLDQAYLQHAAECLLNHDAVFGPAGDGGVVLMGARRRWPDLSRLPWSTAALFEDLRELCESAGFGVATLEPRADIDNVSDLLATKESLNLDRRPARRALRDWLCSHSIGPRPDL